MATFVVLRNPVNILVTDFTNPENLTNDLLILNSLIINKSNTGFSLPLTACALKEHLQIHSCF